MRRRDEPIASRVVVKGTGAYRVRAGGARLASLTPWYVGLGQEQGAPVHARLGRQRLRWLWLALAAWALCGARSARAQDDAASFGVLRATGPGVSAELSSALDDALLEQLRELVGIDHPLLSPTDYEDVQLTVGCEGEAATCLSATAQTLQVDALLVRRLGLDDAGNMRLTLVHFDVAAGRDADSVRASTASGSAAELTAALPGLVRQLFGLAEPEPAAVPTEAAQQTASALPAPLTAAPMPERRHAPSASGRADPGVAPLTWATLSAGAALATVGAVLGLTASASFDELKRRPVRTTDDADRVRHDFESIHTRATLANVLLPASAAVLGVGAALLIRDLSSAGAEQGARDVTLFAAPLSRGGIVTLRTAFGAE